MLPFSPADHGGEELDTAPLGQSHNLVDNLINTLLADLFAALGTVWNADARPKKAQIVIDFSDGSDRGARVF